MSHVDEGILTAWLDGQADAVGADAREIESHVATCAECRALLERLRGERDRSRAILRPAARPAAPAFAAVVARARMQQAQKENARKLSRLGSLAWAATIVIVIGAGWYALQNQRTGAAVEEIGQTSKASGELARNETTPPVVPAAPEARDGRGPSASQANAAPQASARGFADELRAVPAAPAPAPAQELASVLEKADEKKKEREADSKDTGSAELQGKLAEPAALASAEAPVAVAQRQALNRTAPAAAGASAIAPATSDAISLEVATRRLGRTPLTIPGLPVLGYRTAGTGIEVIQGLGGGASTRLIQERPVMAEERLRDRADRPEPAKALGAAAGSKNVDGITVRLMAPVNADSLAKLLGAVR